LTSEGRRAGDPGLVKPGRSRGLLDVPRYRYLLSLLVRKEVSIRYRGSVLGWIWSFAKPAAMFVVYYLALGVFLRLNDAIEGYPIYLFSGFVLMNLFTESFGNATRSLVDNAALIKKIYMPRELFPVSSTIVALVNFLPQVVVLFVAALILGWHPTWEALGAFLLATVIAMVFATGLGMFFGSINVSFRDSQNFVELIIMVSTWASPVLYQLALVREAAPEWLFVLYQLNPLTPAVELMHLAFWEPTLDQPLPEPGAIGMFSLIAFLISFAVLFLGQLVFRRLEGRFAQDL